MIVVVAEIQKHLHLYAAHNTLNGVHRECEMI
jgi:hypothetical protein